MSNLVHQLSDMSDFQGGLLLSKTVLCPKDHRCLIPAAAHICPSVYLSVLTEHQNSIPDFSCTKTSFLTISLSYMNIYEKNTWLRCHMMIEIFLNLRLVKGVHFFILTECIWPLLAEWCCSSLQTMTREVKTVSYLCHPPLCIFTRTKEKCVDVNQCLK